MSTPAVQEALRVLRALTAPEMVEVRRELERGGGGEPGAGVREPRRPTPGDGSAGAEAESWRDDPGWQLVMYAGDWPESGSLSHRPHDLAELSTQPEWASVYVGSRVVATWNRAVALASPSDDSATVAAE